MLLDSKVVIVTGAASPRGIGKATAKALAAQGAKIVILDLKKEDAESAARDLGEDHLGLACNVTDKEACLAAAKAVIEKYGHVDGLINNAGITQPLKTMDIEAANFDAVIDVNLRGTSHVASGHSADEKAKKRQHRLHVFGLRATRRRYLRRSPLQRCKSGRARPRSCDGA